MDEPEIEPLDRIALLKKATCRLNRDPAYWCDLIFKNTKAPRRPPPPPGGRAEREAAEREVIRADAVRQLKRLGWRLVRTIPHG